MNRVTTLLFAALEAVLVVAIGIGISLVPLTLLWGIHFGLAIDWIVFWQASVDIWLLGNGVDLAIALGPELVTALGLPGAETGFDITLALLGFAALIFTLAVRTGRRVAAGSYPILGVVVSLGVYALLALLLTSSAQAAAVAPAPVQGVLLPTLIFAAGVFVGAGAARADQAAIGRGGRGEPSAGTQAAGTSSPTPAGWLRLGRKLRAQLADAAWPLWQKTARFRGRIAPDGLRPEMIAALRGGVAAAAGVLMVSGLAVAVLILMNFATVIGLYEAVQAGYLGGISLTILQLALIPNLVIWAAAWFVGPGIAVGLSTSISPLGTSLSTVPGLPLLGALPQGTLEFGFIGLGVPVLFGFISGVVARQRLDQAVAAPAAAPASSVSEQDAVPASALVRRLITGLALGVVAGLVLGLLSWWSAGSIGPGRLVEVGPAPVLVGAVAAAEIGIAAMLGLLAGARRTGSSRPSALAALRAPLFSKR